MNHPPSEKGGGYPAFSGPGLLPGAKGPAAQAQAKKSGSDFFDKLADAGSDGSGVPFLSLVLEHKELAEHIVADHDGDADNDR